MSSLLYYDLLDLASIPTYVSEHLLLILPFIPADAYTRLFRPYTDMAKAYTDACRTEYPLGYPFGYS